MITEQRVTTGRIEWRVPCVDAVAYWTPDSNEHRGLPPYWRGPRTVSLEKGAPVGCLIGTGDTSLCTFAVSEAVRPVRIGAGVIEETGEFGFWVSSEEPFTVRIDRTGRHFARTLEDVARWWGHDSTQAPQRPVYSTWYAMHQHVNESNVETQARLAAVLGCDTIIVDDGWHSDDRARGYAYVGDWEPNPASFPNMAAHVARVQEHGLAYLLWYALPFAGKHTALFEEAPALTYKERMGASVIDPRDPRTRESLVRKLSRAITEWGMDGLKIDFIDQFAVDDPPPPGPDADCATVTEGVRRLIAALPQGIPVELRQPYVSPALWPHATMIRASDCPLSPAHNRQRTIDLRLIAGPLAVHSDMMMWHPSESPARVAVQLINSLFSVPQISVDLTAQTPSQLAVLRFWLSFFREHAQTLQRGLLEPARPDLHYPFVRAVGSDGVVIAARYAPVPVRAEPGLLLANADSPDVILDVPTDMPADVDATIHDCTGDPIAEHRLTPGLHRIHVPTGGLLALA